MEKLLGPQCSKLFEKRKDKSFVRKVDDLAASMRGFQKEPGNLKEYSPWLSGFKADTFSNELEIPGQHSSKQNFIQYQLRHVLNMPLFYDFYKLALGYGSFYSMDGITFILR